jgi:hypothetical protein
MQPSYNPYAAPAPAAVAPQYAPQPGYAPNGFWMTCDGPRCTFAKNVVFPSVCMRCGAGEPLQRKRKQYIFVPWYGRFFGLIGYYLTRKVTQLDMPLCNTCRANRTTAIWVLVASWMAPLVGVVAMIAGAALDSDGMAGFGLVLFFLGFLAPLVAFLAYAKSKLLPGVIFMDDQSVSFVRIAPQAVQALAHYAQSAQQQGYGQAQAWPQQSQQAYGYGPPQQRSWP